MEKLTLILHTVQPISTVCIIQDSNNESFLGDVNEGCTNKHVISPPSRILSLALTAFQMELGGRGGQDRTRG